MSGKMNYDAIFNVAGEIAKHIEKSELKSHETLTCVSLVFGSLCKLADLSHEQAAELIRIVYEAKE